LATAWGGSIVEVSLNGTNFVNAHDTGREVQPAFYDGNAKGGGSGQPVAGDIIVEQTITPVSGRSRVFQGHYKVTHFGSDLHANAQQEFPAVYVNADYNRFGWGTSA